MNILVCAKFIQGELNPFDGAALECALAAADERPGNVNITVLAMGPAAWVEPMKRLTRLGKSGVLRAVLLSDAAFAGSDTLATSRILSAAIRKLKTENCAESRTESMQFPDWILCGRQTIDGDTAQVGPEIAAMLHVPVTTNVMQRPSFFSDSEALPTRLGVEIVRKHSVLTLERMCELRFPSLRSRPGSVEVWNRERLGISAELCGSAGSPTQVLQTFSAQHGRRKCKFITPNELFPLISELRTHPKQGLKITESPIKLPRIHIVGREAEAQARAIAQEVICVEKNRTPEEIASEIRDADVVLWNADLWGRRTAPQTAAILQTGLCADCTALETDGETLLMYRPARSGDVIAKIRCLSRPQMATVRTSERAADVVIAAGRGISDYWSEIQKLAEELDAEPAASRGLVDSGRVPYEFQIGLTGRTISPKIYVAIGISGAVQHTCAIENSDVVIAINPDRDARIFDFSDYGIAASFPFEKKNSPDVT